MRRAGCPAHPLARDAIGFGECAGDQHIAVRSGKRHAAIVLALFEVFRISLIDDQQHIVRQASVKPLDLAARQP